MAKMGSDDILMTNIEGGGNKVTFTSHGSKEKKLKIAVIVLGVLLAVFIIAVIVIVVLGLKYKEPGTCLTEGCIKAAGTLLEQMDTSVDPCEDFAAFTCGKWVEDNEDTRMIIEAINKNLDDLNSYIQEELKQRHHLKSVSKMLDAYNACLNFDGLDNNTLNTFRTKLRQMGGWPILDKVWNEGTYDWTVLYTHAFKTFDVPSPIVVAVRSNIFDSSENILTIIQSILEGNTPLDMNHTLKVAKLLSGKDISSMQEDARSIEWLDKFILNHTKSIESLYNPTDTEVMTIQELYNRHPSVNWLEFLTNLIPENTKSLGYKISIRDRVMIMGTKYLPVLLENINEGRISKRMLANYMGAKFIQNMFSAYPAKLEDIETVIGNTNGGASQKYKVCVDSFLKTLTGIIDHLNSKYRKSALMDPRMPKYMFSAMDDMITQATWLDVETKKEVKEKLKEMGYHLNYPDWVKDERKVEDYFKELPEMTSNVYENKLNINHFLQVKVFQTILSKNDRTQWLTDPDFSASVMNAYYAFDYNFLVIPSGIQRKPFYTPDRPMYMNFGGMGLIVGHEITHAFDKSGSTKDKYGNTRNWWTPEAKRRFDDGAKCFIDQYSSYEVADGLYVNGEFTLSENIADNGGIRQAFLAYKKWKKDFGDEKLLPGFEKYTTDQMYFISFGASWCTNLNKESLAATILQDNHSPDNMRVRGCLSNLKEFSDAFKCKPGSPMNPQKKCSIW